MSSRVVKTIDDTTTIVRTGRTRFIPRFSLFRGFFMEYQEERMQEHSFSCSILGNYVMHSPPFWVKSNNDFDFNELVGIGRDVA